jgi:AraC-like DNA-binding protein
MSAGPSTVLIAKDDTEMRAFLRKHLSTRHRVHVATDGEEAWRQVRELRPDLLLSDAQMPGTGGRELCRRIRDHSALSSLPVILLTDGPAGQEERPDVGADAVLEKPFAIDDLIRRVEQYLPSYELPDLPGMEGAGEFLKRVIRTIEDRLHDPNFTATELAEAVALSRRHLTRRLKDEMNTTPAALIRTCRIERAKAQLEADPDTIQEVGAAVGFRTASHFSQAFRGEVGCSPSTYRDRHAS